MQGHKQCTRERIEDGNEQFELFAQQKGAAMLGQCFSQASAAPSLGSFVVPGVLWPEKSTAAALQLSKAMLIPLYLGVPLLPWVRQGCLLFYKRWWRGNGRIQGGGRREHCHMACVSLVIFPLFKIQAVIRISLCRTFKLNSSEICTGRQAKMMPTGERRGRRCESEDGGWVGVGLGVEAEFLV